MLALRSLNPLLSQAKVASVSVTSLAMLATAQSPGPQTTAARASIATNMARPTPTATLLPMPTGASATVSATQLPTAVTSDLITSPSCMSVGQTWRHPRDNANMLCVPAGEFLMGSTSSDSDVDEGERPQHKVFLDAFWIDKFEVTNAQFDSCVQAGRCESLGTLRSKTRDRYYGNSQYDNYPVIYVSWNDAKDYCEWAGRRLPTEAEWEKAARGTDGRRYPWGNDPIAGNRLNTCDSNCPFQWRLTSVNDGFADTSPVGNYPAGASPYGAVDVVGNVWEWVADWYSDNYYAVSAYKNPTGPSSGQGRVFRGGSWSNLAQYARVAKRPAFPPDYRNDDLGIRCATSAPGR